MTKVTYAPTDGEDSEFTEAFGMFFESGKAVDVTDEAHLAKLKANPQFKVAGEKAPSARDPNDGREALEKAVDGRSKEAREARAKALEAEQDAAAKERAAEQVRSIAEARDAKQAGE